MRAQIFRSHRFLAKLLAIPVLFWALSGLMHPFIANWFKPSIANRVLPVVAVPVNQQWLDPTQLLAKLNIPVIDQIHVASINERWFYQVITLEGQHRYFDVQTGHESSTAEVTLAKELAAAHAGLTTDKIIAVEKITEFKETYRSINRYLPVYEVQFDTPDKLHVMIDPVTQKLAAFSTRLTRVYRWFFAYAHNWSFFGGPTDLFRVTLMLIVITLVTWVGVAGLYTYVVSRKLANGKKPNRPLYRRMHRFVGISASILFLMLSLSGVLHIYSKYNFDWGFLEHRTSDISLEELQVALPDVLLKYDAPVTQVSLARVGGEPAYRLAISGSAPGEAQYISTRTGNMIENADSLYAKELAAYFAGVDVSQATGSRLLTEFGKTYPAIMKRLPVQQVRIEGGEYFGVTVDTAHAHMASRASPSSLFETVVFLNLHKFHFLDNISKEARDWLSVFSTLLILLTAILGVNMAIQKRRQKQAYAS